MNSSTLYSTIQPTNNARLQMSSARHMSHSPRQPQTWAVQPKFAVGRHVTIEYYDCELQVLSDAEQLETIFLDAAEQSGATIINSSFHAFSPQGASGVVVIAESHFSVHTWPEYGYAAVDMFTCSDSMDLQKAVDVIQGGLNSRQVIVSADMGRGLVSENRIERAIPTSTEMLPNFTLSYRDLFEQNDAWGIATAVDVYGCDPESIRDAEKIRAFVCELCERIDVTRFGECTVVNFGEDDRIAGYSMTQLIETSLVSGHFANATNTAYLDIFSCRYYEPTVVADFAHSFFGGTSHTMQVALRR